MRIKWFSLIRITGLLLVLLYHFFQTIFPGGFFGVDVFFTFSGFLITCPPFRRIWEARQIDLLGFFKRRFYRIVPPVVLMVLVTMPFTLLGSSRLCCWNWWPGCWSSWFYDQLLRNVNRGSYESQFIPHLFVHNWSLAVEVHYYILWGLAVWFLSKRSKSSSQLRGMVFLLSAGAFIISFSPCLLVV